MFQVKVAYVRNVSPNVSEDQLKEMFEVYGAVERVKKLKDYAFIHFAEREHAVKAIDELNNRELDGVNIEVSLAKPQPSNKDRRRGGQAGFGALNANRGYRGGPQRGGRGRGGSYGGDRQGYQDSYDYGYDDHYQGYGGGYRDDYGDGGYGDRYYDDYYGGGYGYSDGYGDAPRGGRSGPPVRGGRGAPFRGGRGSYSGRGGPSERGGRGFGSRGGPPRGGRGGPGGRGAPRGGGIAPGKRKYGADNPQAPVEYPEPKRRFMNQNQPSQWGSQPIAQQPLHHGSGYSGRGSNQEWDTDSTWQQW